MNMDDAKQLKMHIPQLIEQHKDELQSLCLKIHSCPETGLNEFKAAEWITAYLERNGFIVQRGIGSLPTAFIASYGEGKPHIALLAEYDALPELGHACGHNIIASAAAGSAIASRVAVDSFGGKITVVGSPSEEFHCGKELLIREGVFEDIDLAMMIHPGCVNASIISTLACINLEAEFTGLEAHASANPEEGVNALEAIILSFNAINSLRQHIPESARIHGIITDGGQAANIVPAHASAMFMVRANTMEYLESLQQSVEDCFKGASLSTGAKLRCRWAKVCCKPMKTNRKLASLFNQNMVLAGREMETRTVDFASTDMGNISQAIPSIHPIVAIAPIGTSLHSVDFLKAAASEAGIRGMLDGASAMACTITDVLSNQGIINEIKKEFQSRQ